MYLSDLNICLRGNKKAQLRRKSCAGPVDTARDRVSRSAVSVHQSQQPACSLGGATDTIINSSPGVLWVMTDNTGAGRGTRTGFRSWKDDLEEDLAMKCWSHRQHPAVNFRLSAVSRALCFLTFSPGTQKKPQRWIKWRHFQPWIIS